MLNHFSKSMLHLVLPSYQLILIAATALYNSKYLTSSNTNKSTSTKQARTNKKHGPSGAKTILVFGSTGRVGSEMCDEFIKHSFHVCGTTRTVPNSKLSKKGVTPIEFFYGDAESAEDAIRSVDAQFVYIITDFFNAACGKKEVEESHGKIIIDAIKKIGGVQHVILQSVADCDSCPDNVEHFKSKLVIEEYLKSSGLSYSVLRPVAFLENFDDASTYNPLTKGVVKGLWSPDTKLKMVACADIAKAACKIFTHPRPFLGITLDCVSCNVNGLDVSQALSQASQIPCVYKAALPKFVMYLFMRDLYNMVNFFENTGYSSSIEEFKKVVPDAMGPKEWFDMKGQWNNGEKFKRP